MTPRAVSSFAFSVALAFAVSCSPASSEAPVRSPTRDYPLPPPRTSDGQVVGADGVPPADRLEEGPRVGTENGLAPGWHAEEKGLRHDPKQRTGGAIDQKPKTDH